MPRKKDTDKVLQIRITPEIQKAFQEFSKRTRVPNSVLARHIFLSADWFDEDSKHIILTFPKELEDDLEELRHHLHLAVGYLIAGIDDYKTYHHPSKREKANEYKRQWRLEKRKRQKEQKQESDDNDSSKS